MKKLTVDGITFETTKEAKAAERELEAIEKIRDRMDVTDPTYAKVLYEKLIEKEMLHTKVGDKFLAELKGCFDPEEVKENEDTGAVQAEPAEAAGAAAEQEEDTVIPYLEKSVRAQMADTEETPQGETAAARESAPELPPEEPASEETEAPQEESTEEPVEAELDAFMREYGITGLEEPEKDAPENEQPEDEETAFSAEELEAFLGEDETTETSEEKEGAESGPEEEVSFSQSELETLVGEYTENGEEQEAAQTSPEMSFDLKMEEEDDGGQSEVGLELNLDDANLYGDEPDNDTLLAEAMELKKELHQEDLSEVFAEREEQPEKRRFSLYGVLIVSIILNVVLIASMAIMVQVFKNSDNRNILNYERILEQEYQVATPTDAEEGDLQ